jgi:Methyltransferase domain
LEQAVHKGDAMLAAKSAYVAGVRRAGQALTKAGAVHAEAPNRDRRVAHWTYSLLKVHDSAALADLDVPWWTYRAIDVVDAWLSARPHPIRVFEYGSGASTAWLARRTDEVHSVEHHAGFAEMMRPLLQKIADIDLIVIEPVKTATPTVPSNKEGHAGLDFAEYVAAIDKVGGMFDLIVIDGRAREACLRASISHLKSDGIIVFDNTRRARYLTAIAGSGLAERRLRGLTPTLPYPDSTSLLTLH